MKKRFGVREMKNGNFIYDNLEGYEYVDVTYDRYVWRRKGEGKAQEKVKVGTKFVDLHSFQIIKKVLCRQYCKSY